MTSAERPLCSVDIKLPYLFVLLLFCATCLVNKGVYITRVHGSSCSKDACVYTHELELCSWRPCSRTVNVCLRTVNTGAGPHYPCSRPVDTAREHGYCVPTLSIDCAQCAVSVGICLWSDFPTLRLSRSPVLLVELRRPLGSALSSYFSSLEL